MLKSVVAISAKTMRSTVAARMGSAPFLLPLARTVPDNGRPPSITNDCMRGGIVPTRGGHP